jgi:hypothetical protein
MKRANQIRLSKNRFSQKKGDGYQPIEDDFKEFSEYVMHHKLDITLTEFLEHGEVEI